MKEMAVREEPEFFISDIDVEDDLDSRRPVARQARQPRQPREPREPREPRDFSGLRRWALGVMSVMSLALVSGGSWFVYDQHAQWCPIRQVRIEGSFVYLDRDLFTQQIEPVAQGGFFAVNLPGIKEAAAELPWVDSIVIRRVWPDTLVIQVTEKRALARWRKDALISDRGEVFRPSAESLPPGLVELDGPEGSEMKVFKTLQRFEANAKKLSVKLSRIALDSRGSWQVGLADGVLVTLGKEAVQERFERFVRMYERIGTTRQTPVEYVDMRYRNGFAVAYHPKDERVSLQGTR